MKIRYWFGILLAVPLACGQGLQKASRSVAYQPTSSEDFLNIISHIPPCAVGDKKERWGLGRVEKKKD